MTSAIEATREIENELRDARHEDETALSAYRALTAREAALTRTGMGTERRYIEVDGVTRDVDDLDEVEHRALLAEVRRELEVAAERVRTARARRRKAECNAANAQLELMMPRYLEKADEADQCRRVVERALVEILNASIALGRARHAELRERNRVYSAASEAASVTKELREQLQGIIQIGDVPRAFDGGSLDAVDGIERELFGGADDPLDRVTWEHFAQSIWLAISEPEKARVRLSDTALGRAAGL